MDPVPENKPTELIDVVDPTGTWLGVETRAKVHSEGLWHNVFHCLIIRSTSPTRILLQRRHSHSRRFADKVDLSATGHLMAGEKPADGVREITEELGIVVSPDQLTPVGVRLMADNSGGEINRERIHLYFLVDDRPIETFSPAPDEVSALIEIEIEAALQMVDRYSREPSFSVEATEWAPSQQAKAIKLAADDLVPPADGYWATALVAAQRFAAHEVPIAI